MRTPTQQAASRANGAHSRGPKTPEGKRRAAAKPFANDLLAKATVLKNESRQAFHEMVREHMLCIGPRNAVEQDAVEEICSATWRLYRLRAIERKAIDLELATQSSPDNLECVLRACGALAGRNPHILLQRHETRLQNIIRRALTRIETLRRIGPKKIEEITFVDPIPAGPSPAPEPESMRLRTHIPVPRTSARGIPRRTRAEPEKNPPATCQNPPTTRQNPATTRRSPAKPTGRMSRAVPRKPDSIVVLNSRRIHGPSKS